MKKIPFGHTAFVFLLLFLSYHASAQRRQLPDNKLGGAITLNLKPAGTGLDLRAEFPLNRIKLLEGVSLVPQVSYYPWFNPVSEFYAGASVHLGVYAINTWRFYTLAGVSYNGWINHENNPERQGGFSNMGIEAGIGVSKKLRKCMYSFF